MILINNNINRQQIPVTPTQQTLKYGAIAVRADRGDVDLDSDINQLDSGKLRQSNTVPSQFEQFP